MNRSESPLTISHWLGDTDPRPLALFRIGLGATLIQDLVLRLGDFRAFLTDDGILPRSAWPSEWLWSLFNLTGTPAGAALLYGLAFLAALAVLVGYRTRVACFVAWALFVSIHNRNRELVLGGDDLAVILLFWSMFAPLGACFSVDARGKPITPVKAFGARLLQYTPALVYLHAARFKLILGAGSWLHGPAIYQTMQLHGWIRPLGEVLGQYPQLCATLGDGILVMEFLFPLLVLSPLWPERARAIACLVNLAIQFGILLTMKVGIFTDLMLCSTLLYLQPSWLAWAAERWGKLKQLALQQTERSLPLPTPVQLAGMGLLLFQFVAFAALPAAWRHIPDPIRRELLFLGLGLKVDLYSHGYDEQRWTSEGLLTDGRKVEVLSVAAPGLLNDEGWRFSRWTSLVGRAGIHVTELGAYLCRSYDERSGTAKLATFTIVAEGHAPRVPGEPEPTSWRKEVLRQRCSGAPDR